MSALPPIGSVQATPAYTVPGRREGYRVKRLRRTVPPAEETLADEWVVFDVETTGLRPSTDRIVEIGLVRVTTDGRELDTWTTVLNPGRDMGPVHIHGLTNRDVRDAPRQTDSDDWLATAAGPLDGPTVHGRGGQPDRALLRLAEELPASAGR